MSATKEIKASSSRSLPRSSSLPLPSPSRRVHVTASPRGIVAGGVAVPACLLHVDYRHRSCRVIFACNVLRIARPASPRGAGGGGCASAVDLSRDQSASRIERGMNAGVERNESSDA